MFKFISLLLGLMLGSLSVQAVELDTVVIHSNTSAFAAGQLLDSAKALDLSKNAEITVVFPTGGVQTVQGPYRGYLTDPRSKQTPDTQLVTTLSTFIQSNPLLRGQLPPPETLWMVDVSANDRHYCLISSNEVTLLRSENQSQTADSLLIKNKRTEEFAENMWPAHQETLNWPSGLPIVYGDTYTVELKNRQSGAKFKKLILYQLPSNLPTSSHKVVWMVGRGCTPQASRLLASLK